MRTRHPVIRDDHRQVIVAVAHQHVHVRNHAHALNLASQPSVCNHVCASANRSDRVRYLLVVPIRRVHINSDEQLPAAITHRPLGGEGVED